MKWLAIVLMCVAACVVYGVVHDLITARICVEYFTIGHPPVFETDNPTLLGLGWGVIATWWVGVLLGITLACACRLGRWPKREAASLVRPLLGVMIGSFAIATLAGLVGWTAAEKGWVFLIGSIAERVPADRHVAYLVDLWAHSASYLAGFVGGMVLFVVVLLGRRREYVQSGKHILACLAIAATFSLSSCETNTPPSPAPIEANTEEAAAIRPAVDTRQTAERITFADLDCTIQPDIVFREWMLPERVRQLDGRRIRIGGYILPGSQQQVIQEFVLVKNMECKFGPGGQADHLILVKLKPGRSTTYVNRPVDIVGVLQFKPYIGADGNTWGIYEMQCESVGPMRR